MSSGNSSPFVSVSCSVSFRVSSEVVSGVSSGVSTVSGVSSGVSTVSGVSEVVSASSPSLAGDSVVSERTIKWFEACFDFERKNYVILSNLEPFWKRIHGTEKPGKSKEKVLGPVIGIVWKLTFSSFRNTMS